MYQQSMFGAKKEKNIIIFHLKIIKFAAVTNRSILHRRVFVISVSSDVKRIIKSIFQDDLFMEPGTQTMLAVLKTVL